jgi:hypothetical protein
MAGSNYMTASTLRAILCYIDAEHTPKIAYDRDDMVEPLIKKIKDAVGDRDGSEDVCISFAWGEDELERQFFGVCSNIAEIFNFVKGISGEFK